MIVSYLRERRLEQAALPVRSRTLADERKFQVTALRHDPLVRTPQPGSTSRHSRRMSISWRSGNVVELR
jgi:hypothetical protein